MYREMESVDRVIEQSAEEPVLIFKHSTACPVSARAKREMDGFVENDGAAATYLLVVQDDRDKSGEVAEKLGVKHESPQLILLRDGRPEQVWTHYNIKADSLEEAL